MKNKNKKNKKTLKRVYQREAGETREALAPTPRASSLWVNLLIRFTHQSCAVQDEKGEGGQIETGEFPEESPGGEREVLGGKGTRPPSHKGHGLGVLAGEEVEVVVAAAGGAEDGPVRVEGRRRDGGAAAVAQEAGVGLDAGELAAVKVEDLDHVRGRATVNNAVSCVCSYISGGSQRGRRGEEKGKKEK